MAAKDRITVLFTSDLQPPLLSEAEPAEVENLPRLIRDRPLADSHADWEAVLAAVDELVAERRTRSAK